MLQSDSGPCALTANGLFGINPDEKINHRAGCDLLGQRGQRSVVVAARWRRGTGLPHRAAGARRSAGQRHGQWHGQPGDAGVGADTRHPRGFQQRGQGGPAS